MSTGPTHLQAPPSPWEPGEPSSLQVWGVSAQGSRGPSLERCARAGGPSGALGFLSGLGPWDLGCGAGAGGCWEAVSREAPCWGSQAELRVWVGQADCWGSWGQCPPFQKWGISPCPAVGGCSSSKEASSWERGASLSKDRYPWMGEVLRALAPPSLCSPFLRSRPGQEGGSGRH